MGDGEEGKGATTAIPKIVKLSMWSKIKALKSSTLQFGRSDQSLQSLLTLRNTPKFDNFDQAMKGFKKHSQRIALRFVTEMTKKIDSSKLGNL